MNYNDPMDDSADPMDSASRSYEAMGKDYASGGSGYHGEPGWGGAGGNDGDPYDAWSRAYTGMGSAYKNWQQAQPGFDYKVGDLAGFGGIANMITRNLANQARWNRTAPYGSKTSGGGWQGGAESRHGVDTFGPGTAGFGPGTTSTGAGTGTSGAGAGIYPSVYTDPVTGRLLYQSQSVGGTSNLSYADQQLLDQLMGTNVASQNVQQQMGVLKDTIKRLKASGADTSYYEQELARLQGLGTQGVSANNPLLQAVNSGASLQAANQLLENTVANQLRSGEETAARRGLGTLGSPMNDQLRASLGLSTAQARTQNQANAEREALSKRMNIMSFLKNSQNQDFTQEMGRTGIGMTLGDWENQRKIAEIAQANQNAQFGQNLNYLQGLQSDANRNAWLSTIGDVAGSIDWGSFF